MTTAFCIYSETDSSLDFYKRDMIPVIGNAFEQKIITKIWIGFETVFYTSTTLKR